MHRSWQTIILVLAVAVSAHAGFTEQLQFGTRFTNSLACPYGDSHNFLDLPVADYWFSIPIHNDYVFVNLYTTNGDGTFAGQNEFGGAATYTIEMSWGDHDRDRDLDMAVAKHRTGRGQ